MCKCVQSFSTLLPQFSLPFIQCFKDFQIHLSEKVLWSWALGEENSSNWSSAIESFHKLDINTIDTNSGCLAAISFAFRGHRNNFL